MNWEKYMESACIIGKELMVVQEKQIYIMRKEQLL